MMMLSFNYTSLERGFESISLRCQYCKAEETRPWPRSRKSDEGSDQHETSGDRDNPQYSSQMVHGEVRPNDRRLPDQDTDRAPVNALLNVERGFPADTPWHLRILSPTYSQGFLSSQKTRISISYGERD
jgi:hypothetical protein